MTFAARFRNWIGEEIGSNAVPAIRAHLEQRGYRLFSFMEHDGRWRRDVYHPEHGFFQAHGVEDCEALLRILCQIWLVESIATVPEQG